MALRDYSLSARITIGALIVVLAGAMMLMHIENDRLRDFYINELGAHLGHDLESQSTRLNQTVSKLQQDVLFLANIPAISGIARATLNNGYDSLYGNTISIWAERLQQNFSAFSMANPDYYRIRFYGVDNVGREIVNIDNRGVKIATRSSRQFHSKREIKHIKSALGVNEGQVKITEIYLDQQQEYFEQPYRHTLRASTPAFTPSGELFGIVSIYMDAERMLRTNVSDFPGVQTFIANQDGQYLLRPDSRQAFRWVKHSNEAIFTDFPVISAMSIPQAADFLPLKVDITGSGNPLITAKKIHYDPSNPLRYLILMNYLPGTVAEQQIGKIPANNILKGVMMMMLIGGIATLVLRRTFLPLRQITAAADRIADGDNDLRLPQSRGGEIGSLARALNAMLSKLSHRERLLVESESRYRRLHESMTDAFAKVDMSGNLLEFNKSFQQILGYSAEELQNLNYQDLTPKKWHEFEVAIIEDQVIPHGYSTVYEKEYVRKDGTVFPVELKCFLLRDANNRPEAIWAIVRDITERKRAERQMHDLTAHLLSVREEEKNSIAREIHDDLGGTLTALKIEAYWLKAKLAANQAPDSLCHVKEMSELIDNASGIVRKIITGLRPTILEDLGLVAALEWKAEKFKKLTGIDCSVNCLEDSAPVDKQSSIALFRIFQEALTNVSRHSGATRVEVEYCCNDDEIMLTVSDNGCGLPDSHHDSSYAFGLRGMCERVRQLGGMIELDSPQEGGFSVNVVLPQEVNERRKYDPNFDRRRPQYCAPGTHAHSGE